MREPPAEELDEQLRDGDGKPLVLDIRHEDNEESRVPDSLGVGVCDERTPSENSRRTPGASRERVERTNVGRESAPSTSRPNRVPTTARLSDS
ncbi:hypothetical protein [Haloprofundus halophilus]|uniref:hypothetical protein n=1 Tax=Haloprofundus halophilus TaxID=2283527 RepID=UPI000E43E2DC|nr:hypothetical protein [Haloprofundus halophilus]